MNYDHPTRKLRFPVVEFFNMLQAHLVPFLEKLLKPSSLLNVCFIQVRACEVIIRDTFPILFKQFKSEERPSHRQSYLDLVTNFVTASCHFKGNVGVSRSWKKKLINPS